MGKASPSPGPSSSPAGAELVAAVTVAAVITAVFGGLGWRWETLVNFSALGAPYRYVAEFYYTLMVQPVRLGAFVYTSLCSPGLMRSPTLNQAAALLATATYVTVILAFLYLVIGRSGTRVEVFSAVIVAPAVLAAIYALANWLWVFFNEDIAMRWYLPHGAGP